MTLRLLLAENGRACAVLSPWRGTRQHMLIVLTDRWGGKTLRESKQKLDGATQHTAGVQWVVIYLPTTSFIAYQIILPIWEDQDSVSTNWTYFTAPHSTDHQATLVRLLPDYMWNVGGIGRGSEASSTDNRDSGKAQNPEKKSNGEMVQVQFIYSSN